MKINNKILSIPPYISTAWKNIVSLQTKENTLVVDLEDGRSVEIPNLDKQSIEIIFSAHAAHLEASHMNLPVAMNEIPFHFAIGTLDEMGGPSIMQHNPLQGNSPDIPQEILSKILEITKIVSPDESHSTLKAEPHCNCVHCQISRAMHGTTLTETVNESCVQEEEVSPNELQFQQWEIVPTGDKLYSITNKLDRNEQYNVFLGEPVGCTCGKTGCEHILSVLRS